MLPAIAWTVLVLSITFAINVVVPLWRNIHLAKASGLPFVIVPYYSYNRITALLMFRTLLRSCTKLYGEPSPASWRTLVTSTWPWKHRYTPFEILKTDSFLTVAPGGIIMQTADPDVTHQIFSRPNDFTKPSHLYKPINIYGDNVVAAEGATWRHHRKLLSPVFSESNNILVWKQSLQLGQAMLSRWLDQQGKAITTLAQDTMLLSLSVFGRAGLGQTIRWPSVSSSSAQGQSAQDEEAPTGHQMTFTVAQTTLLRNVIYIVVLPTFLLRHLPFKIVKTSYQAYLEWGQYLREIVSSKREAIARFETSGSNTRDLLSQLLQEHEKTTTGSVSSSPRLSDSEILGNLFVMLLAGHETSASSIHFCLALLAMHPQIQRDVQNELDELFLGRSPDQWQYEKDLPRLLNGKLNAVVHEELRLFAPAITVPKFSTTPQTLQIQGKNIVVPAKTIIRLCVPSMHRNPSCWPVVPSIDKDGTCIDDLDSFRPARWFNRDGSWYQPPRGAYIPFSDGARACLGKRFAQVEILAVLAVVLSSYSVELDVDEPALLSDLGVVVSNGEPSQASGGKGQEEHEDNERELWERARKTATSTMRHKMMVNITLQLQKGNCIPVRMVKRGEERFDTLLRA